jgi:hypothetical protein
VSQESGSPQAVGAVIEIIERGPGDGGAPGIIVPNEVRINGMPLLMPYGKSIKVHEMEFPPQDAVLVTLTVFARRVVIGVDEDAKPQPAT